MLGAIIGDTIGSVYEFNNTRDFNFKLFTDRSNYTDDSIMTIAVAHWAMTDKQYTHAQLEQIMVHYAQAFPCPMGGYGGGFNTWLFHPEALIDYKTGQKASVRCPYNSWGNGSGMRAPALGWLFDTLEETERVAAISAAITHNHPEGIKGAQAVAAAVYMARKGATKAEMVQYITRRFGYDLSVTWSELHRSYGWDSSCQGTVPQAIIAFLHSTDFESAIRSAIAIGGDSDTIACITGGIAEAYYKEIPAHMVVPTWRLLPAQLRQVLLSFAAGDYAECFHRYIDPHLQQREYTPERIVHLEQNEVFVFGSNLLGQHAGGAAYAAHQKFGAQWGLGVGPSGQSYAIPTMHGGVQSIRPYVDQFIRYAKKHPHLKFYVTRIGCGIAGFSDSEIAPLFAAALPLSNVVLPHSFCEVLKAK